MGDNLTKFPNGLSGAGVLHAAEVTFTENGAGTYTGSIAVPAGAYILDIVVQAVALWAAGTSAALNVGDGDDADGFFAAVNLKATDLLAGETLSLLGGGQGGKAGAYNAGTNTHWSGLYNAAARTITGVVVSVGAGTTGRTRLLVSYVIPAAGETTAATKA